MSEYLANKDALSNVPGRLTGDGATAVAMTIPLVGDTFQGSAIDEESRWSVAEDNNATVVQADGELTLTAPAAGDAAAFSTIKSYPLLSGSDLVLRGVVRFDTAGEAGNTRSFGLWADADNYALFVLEGSNWLCRVYCDGSPFDTDASISTPAASSQANLELEIRLTKSRVFFFADGGGGKLQVGSFTAVGKTGPLMTNSRVYAFASNVSVSPAAVSNVMVFSEVSLVRSFENWPTACRVARIDGATSTLVARGPVFYCGLKGLKPDAGAVAVYDGISSSGGTLIDEYTEHVNGFPHLPGPIECADGLYVVNGSSSYAAYVYYVVA